MDESTKLIHKEANMIQLTSEEFLGCLRSYAKLIVRHARMIEEYPGNEKLIGELKRMLNRYDELHSEYLKVAKEEEK